VITKNPGEGSIARNPKHTDGFFERFDLHEAVFTRRSPFSISVPVFPHSLRATSFSRSYHEFRPWMQNPSGVRMLLSHR
jgi:hypothetical protein